MSFISNFGFWGGGWTGWILPFLFGLGVVVFFHELGHFLVARWVGVKVMVFSVGFGPEIVGFNDRHGTRWKLAAIPLGGYVKFFGDQNAASVPDQEAVVAMTEEEKSQSFVHKSLPRRAAVVVAGPLANFILSTLIFASVFMIYGKPSATPLVGTVEAGSAADKAGFRPGDIVLTIDGRNIETFDQLRRTILISGGRTLRITVNRDGAKTDLQATPVMVEVDGPAGRVEEPRLGVGYVPSPGDPVTEKVGVAAAIALGVGKTWEVIEITMTYLGRVVTGYESPKQIGGVIGIAQMSGQVANMGFMSTLWLAGMLSVSIGLLNLFPIPLLDGGHLLFYAIEGLRGRPLSERTQEMGFRFGLAAVLFLMIFGAYNDVSRLRWLQWLWS